MRKILLLHVHGADIFFFLTGYLEISLPNQNPGLSSARQSHQPLHHRAVKIVETMLHIIYELAK